MPITKGAIKSMKQSRVRRDRNAHYTNHMKSMLKLILGYIEKNDFEKAKKILPNVMHAVDNAAKKNLIHKNNAAHKKSRVQRALNKIEGKKPVAEKKSEKKAK